MAITAMLKNPDTHLNDFGYVDSEGVAGCIAFDTDTRTRVLYLTPEGVATVRAMGIKEEEKG
jgi:hypothetical protein